VTAVVNTVTSNDKCLGSLEAALKATGARLFFNKGGESWFTVNGQLRGAQQLLALPGMQGVDPNSISEVDLVSEAWWPVRSIRNTAHFAKVMFSEPWREIQKKEMADGYISAISWGYNRAILTVANLHPLVRPSDVPSRVSVGDDPENEWTKANTASDPKPIFAGEFDQDMQMPFDTNSDGIHPENNFKYGTSHQLVMASDAGLKHTQFVSLTTSNVFVDTMKFHKGKSFPQALVQAVQAALDRAATECSRANADQELAELKQLQSSRTLTPVDLDAFERQRRSEISKYTSREPQLFDAIQALK
jgi:hypothetical protein